jgi:hypothetical protein
MAKLSQPVELEPPLYIRWTTDACPYALELRLDLISRLKGELEQSAELGVEAGGLFFGVFPSAASPTLRLDELVFVPRQRDGGPEYKLDEAQIRQLVDLGAAARHTERAVVGFFRSHVRTTPLVPSASDLSMLSQQFPEGLFAFLLINSASPPQGAFYLAMTGRLPDTPSTPVFSFDESNFRSLPEVPEEATEDVRNFGLGRPKAASTFPWAAVAILAFLLLLIGMWSFGSRIAQMLRPNSNQIGLNVMATGSNLKITWDHSAPVLLKALGATIDIQDGHSQREVRLDSEDLRMGQIAYERLTRKVNVVVRLDAPGLHLPPQTFDWTGE